MKYIALVGDLVNSRKIPERIAFDEALLNKLRLLSKDNSEIASPYTLIGDEIQAVYTNSNFIFRDAVEILAEIHPRRMRFAFGVGELIKPINKQQAIEMDGPAFYLARDGINELKNNRKIFNLNGNDLEELKLLKEILFYISHNLLTWNLTRLNTLKLRQRGLEVKEIAEELGRAENTIYKTIETGMLDTVESIFKQISKIITRIL